MPRNFVIDFMILFQWSSTLSVKLRSLACLFAAFYPDFFGLFFKPFFLVNFTFFFCVSVLDFSMPLGPGDEVIHFYITQSTPTHSLISGNPLLRLG